MGANGSRPFPGQNQPTTVYTSSLRSVSSSRGTYNLIRKIGSGAFGTVFLGSRRNELFAVKVLKVTDRSMLASSLKELEALTALDHPHIVKVYDFFGNDSSQELFIVMEYCENGDLMGFLEKLVENEDNKLGLFNHAMQWLIEMFNALRAVHAKGIIHRDIKPANFFVTKDFRIKLGDFGVSRLDGGNQTGAYTFAGTIAYMAPELLKQQSYSSKADIWSLGITFLQVVCQQFDVRFLQEVPQLAINDQMHKIVQQVLQPTARHLLSRMLQVDHHKRCSADELLNDPLLTQWNSIARQEALGKLELPDARVLNDNPLAVFPFIDRVLDGDEQQVKNSLAALNRLHFMDTLTPRSKAVIAVELCRAPVLKKLVSLLTSNTRLVMALLLFCLSQFSNDREKQREVQAILVKAGFVPLLVLLFVLEDVQQESIPMTVAHLFAMNNPEIQTALLELSFGSLLDKYSTRDPNRAMLVLSDFESLTDLDEFQQLKSNFLKTFAKADETDSSLCLDLIRGRESSTDLIVQAGVVPYLSKLLALHKFRWSSSKSIILKALSSLSSLITDVRQGVVRDSFCGICTLNSTGPTYTEQIFVRCQTCFSGQSGLGLCSTCVHTCHSGHQTKFGFSSSAYCDCSIAPHQAQCTACPPAEQRAPTIAHGASPAHFTSSSVPNKFSCKEAGESSLLFTCQSPKIVSVSGTSFMLDKVADNPNVVSYFEIRWKNVTSLGGIGFAAARECKIDSLVGLDETQDSFGWHGDDGDIYRRKQRVCSFNPYSTFDTVGCGLTKSGTFFVTMNGILVGQPIKFLQSGVYTPCVSFDGKSEFEVLPPSAWKASWLRSDGFHEANGSPCWRPQCSKLINPFVSASIAQQTAAIFIRAADETSDADSKKLVDMSLRLLLHLCRLDPKFVSILQGDSSFASQLGKIPSSSSVFHGSKGVARKLCSFVSPTQGGNTQARKSPSPPIPVKAPTRNPTAAPSSNVPPVLNRFPQFGASSPPTASNSSPSSDRRSSTNLSPPATVIGASGLKIDVSQKGETTKRILRVPQACSDCSMLRTLVARKYDKLADDISKLTLLTTDKEYVLDEDMLVEIQSGEVSGEIIVEFKRR